MPEIAEVEFFRRRWDEAGRGRRIVRVNARTGSRVFRGEDLKLLGSIEGKPMAWSAASGKQMLFKFGRTNWLGVHLGMTGELLVFPGGTAAGKHDHLVLETKGASLVFRDPRMFGRIRCGTGPRPPEWWQALAPAILSKEFSTGAVDEFLHRRGRRPIKAVLLMQERFPGIGNWMADEILWRAAIHPRRAAGSLSGAETRKLWRECRNVVRQALKAIAGEGGLLPKDLNVGIPRTWLFHHRWRPGGTCPRTGARLAHAEIGGRTTCWSPARQKLPDKS